MTNGVFSPGMSNRARVLSLLRSRGDLSRQEIADRTGLSWGGTTNIINLLLEQGMIQEEPVPQPGRGRTPNKLRLNEEDFLTIGLDINRQGLSGSVVNLQGKSIRLFRRANPPAEAETLLNRVKGFLREIRSAFEGRHFLGIGISMQGIVNAGEGVSVSVPGIPDWRNVPIRDLISAKEELPVLLEHDPVCVLHTFHPHGEVQNALLLRVDKSIGMAATVGGHLLRGPNVLEIAHTIVVEDGLPCPCGQKGCLDAYLAPCLKGDVFQPEAFERALPLLCGALINSAHLFAPQRIYLTGRLMDFSDRFYDSLMDLLRRNPFMAAIPVTVCPEGDAAVLGAASLAIEKFLKEDLI